jgi:FMN phosphatase YigB (HAD superfamily)
MHFSFDFWNTIGIPNPEGSKARNRVLADVFSTSYEDAATRYRAAKALIDGRSESTGTQESRDTSIQTLINTFGSKCPVSNQQLAYMLVDVFHEHPPTIAPEMPILLDRLVEDGHTLSITSNTNIIHGVDIVKAVTGVLPFSFSVFSDEYLWAKPNPLMFLHVWAKAMALNPEVTSESDIIHVGDSVVCDIKGARAVGLKTIQVTNAAVAANEINTTLSGIFK